MKKYILIFIILTFTSGIVTAQDSDEPIRFTTSYAYSISSGNFTSSEKKAVWSFLEYPQSHVRLETDGEVSKFRIEGVKRLRKTSEESTLEITLKDVNQKFHLTYFLGGKGNYRMTVYTDRFLQEDGSYSKVDFYTTYEIEDMGDLL